MLRPPKEEELQKGEMCCCFF